MPVLTNIGYTVDWKQVTVITWGGLRGAVGLALALVVVQTPGIPLTIGSKASLNLSLSLPFHGLKSTPLSKYLIHLVFVHMLYGRCAHNY